MRHTGIDHTTICPYSHEENTIVERINKEILRHLRAYLFDKDIVTEWTRAYRQVQRIINTSKVSSIGASPAELLNINLEQWIFNPEAEHNAQPHDRRLGNIVAKNILVQQRLQQIAADLLQRKDAEHMQREHRDITRFDIDSYVLIEYPDQKIRSGHPTNKLRLPLKGPLKVVGRKDANTYLLQDLSTNKVNPVNMSRMRTFRYDPERTNPEDIARRDHGEIYVDFIVDHVRPEGNRKREMDFRVRWVGMTAVDDRWLKWTDVRHLPQLHTYLRDNGMADLIPKEFR